MHEYLKELLPVAERMGEPKTILMHSGDGIFGDDIQIEGRAMDGRAFRIWVQFEKEDKPDDGQS